MTTATILLMLAGLLLSGLAVEAFGRYTALPRVTLLVVFGFLIGPDALDLLPIPPGQWFGLTAEVALVMVGFLLGERLTVRRLRAHGLEVLSISGIVVLVTSGLVALGLWLAGASPTVALVLGAIASATAPAATYDVVAESGAKGPFTDTLLGVVAVDDAWGLLVFSLALAAAGVLGGSVAPGAALAAGLWEILGALGLGIALGVPTASLTHRVRPGEPTVLEALGVVFLCGGLALWLEVSFVLAAMALGATTANRARRHRRRPFHAIADIEQPFMVVFFVLAGASLHLDALALIGGLGILYLLLRVVGRVAGAWAGARLAGAPATSRRWMGVALLPQAGIALGMALVAAERFPELGATLLPLAIGATVVFELVGPVCTHRALLRAGEIPGRSAPPPS